MELDPESLVVEPFFPGPDEDYSSVNAAVCTGCMSTCGINPP
jgi:hypothetical protein